MYEREDNTMRRRLERKDITKEYLKKLYSSFDKDTIEYIKEENDDNLSSQFVYTEEPTPMSWDYPGDDGKGYFTDYDWYVGNMFGIIVEQLYEEARSMDGYDYGINHFRNDVVRALFIDTTTNIYELFPIILDEEDYQEACWEKHVDDKWVQE